MRPIARAGRPSKIYPMKRFNGRQHIDLQNMGPFGGMFVPYNLPSYYRFGHPGQAARQQPRKGLDPLDGNADDPNCFRGNRHRQLRRLFQRLTMKSWALVRIAWAWAEPLLANLSALNSDMSTIKKKTGRTLPSGRIL